MKITVRELRRLIGGGLREAMKQRCPSCGSTDVIDESQFRSQLQPGPHARKFCNECKNIWAPQRGNVGSDVSVTRSRRARQDEGFSVRRLLEAGPDDDTADDEGDDEELNIDDAADGDAGGDDATDASKTSSDQPALMPDGTSIDAQIDRYMIDYEKEGTRAVKEGFDARALARRLLESDEPQLPADAGSSSSGFDVESFASSVARLIENFESLVEVRATLVKRAEAFLRKGHSGDVVQSFLDTMRERHDIDADAEVDGVDEIEVPAAAGAGPGGGAGA